MNFISRSNRTEKGNANASFVGIRIQSVAVVFIVFSLLTSSLVVAANQAKVSSTIPNRYQDIRYPEWKYLAPFPDDYKVNLDGGAIAYLLPDSTLDLVAVTLFSRLPNQANKPDQVAALKLYSSLLKAGGAGDLTPEKLEDSLEYVAAGLSAGLDDWQGDASLNCLGKNANELLDLLPTVILKPRLDETVFRLRKREMLENLKHRYDTPRGVIGVAWERVMYGSHPSNWLANESEVNALSVKSLNALKGKGFATTSLVFAVSGRFDKLDMTKRLNGLLKEVPKKNNQEVVKPFRGPEKPGVYLVDKPFSQATIYMGAPGVQRPHPDYYRLLVASYIFGDGGFTSRLVEKVRSQEGLAYGVSSDVGSEYNRKGLVSVNLQTKVETGAYAIKLVFDEMATLIKSGVTDDEVQKAKEGLIKSLPTLFDAPSATARIFAQGEIWKRDATHFIDYEKAIKEMKRSEIEDAFKRYFIPDSMRIVVVGPKEALTKKDVRGLSLSSFGKVTELSTTYLDSRE